MQTSLALIALVMGLPLSASVALAKASIHLPEPGVPGTPGQQLQDAVNDSGNAGVRIWLASGSYSLDPAKPNGGRLFLQPGMDIIGENEYSDCDGDGLGPVGACSGDPTPSSTQQEAQRLLMVRPSSAAEWRCRGPCRSNNLIEGVRSAPACHRRYGGRGQAPPRS
jgi:hypothetical protein